jgi:hypothetical protein
MTTGLTLSDETAVEVTHPQVGGPSDLFDALSDFFEVCKFALAHGADEGCPPCAYMSEGPPAWDACPCLIAWAGAPAVGDTFPLQPSLAPMHRVELGRQVNLVPMTAVVLRCQAVIKEDGSLPQPPEHAKVTSSILSDGWTLWNHLREAKRQGILFPGQGGKREFSLEVGIAYNPQGGAAGSAVTIRTELDGYSPDLTGLTLS